jgi:hypothetical protein
VEVSTATVKHGSVVSPEEPVVLRRAVTPVKLPTDRACLIGASLFMFQITPEIGKTFSLAEVLIMIEANRLEKLRAETLPIVSREDEAHIS